MNPTTAFLKSSSSTRWLARQAQDPFVRSRSGAYRARSAFKLKDLAHKYPILGRRVVDLGAAPGGWSQVAAERQRQYRGRGVVVAVDLLPIEAMPGVQVVEGDFFDPSVQSRVLELLKAAPMARYDVKPREAYGLKKEAETGVDGANREEAEGGTPVGPAATADIESEDPRRPRAESAAAAGLADCVLSDMMASMSGIRDRDVQSSLDLVGAATWLAHSVLRPKDDEYAGGTLV